MRPMAVIKPDRKIASTMLGLILVLALTVFIFTGENREAITYRSWKVANNSPVMEIPKTAYLTFDDGPTEVTGQLLDILKEQKVPATFFVVGSCHELDNAKRDALWKRMAKEGHTIGLHVYAHISYPKLYASAQAYTDSLNKLDAEVFAATGVHSKIYRFPAGSNNSFCSKAEYTQIVETMSQKGLEYYDWNVDGQDAVRINTTADAVANHVIRDAKKQTSPVILLHDIPMCKGSVEAIPRIINELKAAGYTFDTVDHLSVPVHQNIR